MNNPNQAIDFDALRQFSPLDRLSRDDSQELLRTSISSRLSAGTPIFDQGTQDKRVYFLMEGEVELFTAQRKQVIIAAGSMTARQPLGAHLPGQISASAHSDVTLLSFDADMLELFISWTNPSAYQVTEMAVGQNHEWMDRLLRSRGLLRFNEDQIQSLLNRMREVKVHAGDVVIKQDDHDEFYYIVKEGRCQVSRKPEANSKEINLAVLNEGDAFGEEALLADGARNASVTMIEDGALMQLSKKDFSEALADPLLNTVSWQESNELISLGAVFLDVRMPEEFGAAHLPGAFNIPLSMLRLKLKVLDTNRKYIVYCDDGSRSAVAAFLLSRHGFDAFILDGGLSATTITRPAENTAANDAVVIVPTVTEVVTPKQSASKPVSRSLADHWGDLVEDAPTELLEQQAPEQTVEKTKPFVSRITANAQAAPVKLASSNVTHIENEASAHNFKHGTAVGIVLAMALTATASFSIYLLGTDRLIQMLGQAVVAAQGLMNTTLEKIDPQTPPAPTLSAPVITPAVTAPATVEASTPPSTPITESTPWLNPSDNILPDMIDAPSATATTDTAASSTIQP
ncbi:MAG: cyclic nucleotide-binding domain-containing protein [Gammaproteobacteria bacterium]|nr:cyclic nucleotide-binding domain-containing protein [Gammaproteobacteria bacterium]